MRGVIFLIILTCLIGCDESPSSTPSHLAINPSAHQETVNSAVLASTNVPELKKASQVVSYQTADKVPNISCDSNVLDCAHLISIFQKYHPPLFEFELIDETKISSGYKAIIVRANGMAPTDIKSADYWKSESYGVFIVDESKEHVLTLDIFPTQRSGDYDVKLGTHGEGWLHIHGAGATYGDVEITRKYFFDIKDKKFLAAITKGVEVSASRLIEFNGDVYSIGTSDDKKTIITTIQSQQGSQVSIKVTDTIENEKIEVICEVTKDGDKLILAGETNQYIFAKNAWKKTPIAPSRKSGGILGVQLKEFKKIWFPAKDAAELAIDQVIDGKAHKFFIMSNANTSLGYSPPAQGIIDLHEGTQTFYALPQPSYDLFSQSRPGRVADGYTKNATEIQTEINTYQSQDNLIWFGLGFYDGEGTSGIGGIGTFDPVSKKYKISYLKEISASSVYSILVDDDAIWLGLGSQPEGDAYGNGVARINRKDGAFTHYEIPGLSKAIVKANKSIYIGTSAGVASINENGEINFIHLSINADGSYSAQMKNK